MKRLLCPAFLGSAALLLTPLCASAQAQHPISVSRCEPSRNAVAGTGWVPGYYPAGPFYWPSVYGYRYYQPPFRATNPTLGIDYRNETSTAMKTIEFGLIANGNLVAEVRDVGTFSPGVEIKHEFGLSPNVFPLRTALARCVPLRITYEDGRTWRNPRLPLLRRRLEP